MRFGNQPRRPDVCTGRIEIDWALSSMMPKAVPAAPLGVLARQCHAEPTLRPLQRSQTRRLMIWHP
jgi:hypothetical protein